MGLLKAAFGSAGGVLADQWREYFYCDSMDADTLAVKGQKRVSDSRSSNTKGTENIITNGAVIAVNEGQAMMIVDQGKVVEFTAEPGEFTWDSSSQPSVFCGGLGEGLKKSFEQFGRRFGFGGDAGSDQRVYFFNLKEIVGNKYGTSSPVPFRVVDRNINLDMDTAVRCNGEYSYKMVDPMRFYVNICGNVEEPYTRDNLASQMKAELLTALQPAFARISEMGIRYSAVPAHTTEVCQALDQELSQKWTELRGLKIVSFGCNSITLPEDVEKKISNLQSAASLGSSDAMRKGFMTESLGGALGDAAANEGGAMQGFMGVGMAMNSMGGQMGGMMEGSQPVQNSYKVSDNGGFGGAAGAGAGVAAAGGWTCECGQAGNAGNFCSNCGKPKPVDNSWTCECGATNAGNFCSNCGKPRPAAGPWTCTCGATNEGKFCSNCGSPRP